MYCWHLYIYKTIISYVKWVRSSLQSFLLKWHHDMQIWSTCCYFSGLFCQHCLAIPAGWGGGSTWELDKKLHIISVTNITTRTVFLLHWGEFLPPTGVADAGQTEASHAGQSRARQGGFLGDLYNVWASLDMPTHSPACCVRSQSSWPSC